MSSIEEWLETDGEPGSVGHVVHRKEHTRHEGRPVERIVAQGEHLARVAEQHLFVRDMAAHPHRVDTNTRDIRPARARKCAVGGIGR